MLMKGLVTTVIHYAPMGIVCSLMVIEIYKLYTIVKG